MISNDIQWLSCVRPQALHCDPTQGTGVVLECVRGSNELRVHSDHFNPWVPYISKRKRLHLFYSGSVSTQEKVHVEVLAVQGCFN